MIIAPNPLVALNNARNLPRNLPDYPESKLTRRKVLSRQKMKSESNFGGYYWRLQLECGHTEKRRCSSRGADAVQQAHCRQCAGEPVKKRIYH